jgi:hypothetical protein
MNSKLWFALVLVTSLSVLQVGCGDDTDTGTDTGNSDTDTDADTDTDSDADSDTDVEAGANGAVCDLNEGCLAGFCETFQGVPVDAEAVCADGPGADQLRILANVRDFYTEETIADLEIKITGALSAVMNPSGAPALATVTTDANGEFDVTGGTEFTTTPLGIVAIAEATDYYLTITGLVEPELEGGVYPQGVRNHDIKAVSQAKLDEWSGMLASFDELAAYLPLGPAAGAVFGKIRYLEDGSAVSGAVITSESGSTSALIYYLNEAEDGFNQTETGGSGIFAMFNPGLAERFVAMKDGVMVSRSPATVGQTAGSIYAATIQVEGAAEAR